jgi:hypothetical protein
MPEHGFPLQKKNKGPPIGGPLFLALKSDGWLLALKPSASIGLDQGWRQL